MEPSDDSRDDLERLRKLEEELAFWHNKAIGSLRPETLAAAVNTQQLEALTYHLLKQKKNTDEAMAKLAAKEKELALAVENIKTLENELDAKRRELEKVHKSSGPPVKAYDMQVPGQRFGASGIPSEEELDSLFGPEPGIPSAVASPSKRDPKTFKDFIQLLKRMERLNVYDATLLLDVSQDQVMIWTEPLMKKGYVKFEGLHDKILVATTKMLNSR